MLLTFTAGVVLAQERRVTGKVTAADDGSTLPGVNVVVRGTTNGTTTDANGAYALSVPDDATLTFSFIGLTTEEVVVGGRTVIDVVMRADVTQLSEVVVVGYGTQSKRDLSGSISSVQGKDIATLPVQSFEQALGGRSTGVQVNIPNGVMNNPPVIRIRGVSSMSLSSFPLVVIDGIPSFTGDNSATNAPNNPLANINPSDIESVEVLKDASASAIYGSRAANGVILITTKRGAKGRTKVTLDSWVGATQAFRLFDVMNADQYMATKNEAVENLRANILGNDPTTPINKQPVSGPFKPTLDANGNPVSTNWYDHVYRTGFSHSNSLNISGATDKTNYYVSVGYTGQEGMLKKNDFDRTSARLNLDQKLTDKVTFGTNFSYANTKNAAPSTGSLPGAAFGTAGLGRLPLVLPPNVPAFNADGSYNLAGAGLGPGANLTPTSNPLSPSSLVTGYYNPDQILATNLFTSESNQIQGSIYLNWEIIKGLNARTMFGINNTTFEDLSWQSAMGGDGYPTGNATNTYRTNKRWDWQNTLQYDKSFNKHNVSVLGGIEEQYTVTNRWGASRTIVADPFFNTYQGNFTNIAAANNFQGENYLLSYFSRVNYDYGKKYFASVNLRRDGYSAWGNQKWGTFWGAALGYTISEENFWKESAALNKVSFFKLKASYGEVGNSQGIGDFASLQTYGSGLYGDAATLGYNQAGNPALTWETSKKTDIGFMYGILNDRIQGEFSYYKTVVDGLILDVAQAPSKGIPNPNVINSVQANVGSMYNKGIEFSIKFNAVTTPNFRWSTSLNVTTLKNEVTQLNSPGAKIPNTTLGLETVNFTQVGQSIGSLIAVPTVGIDPANGRRMFQKADGSIVEYNFGATNPWTNVSDGSKATAASQAADGVVYGPVLPKYFGGWDNTFNYKNFDLGVFFQYSGGNYIYNGTKAGLHDQRFWNNRTDILDHWTPENTSGKWPRIVYGDNLSNGSALVISNNVEKGDFIRLRNVMLGYTFPKALLERVKLSNLRIYAQCQNAFMITKYSGIDPENQANGNSPTGAGVDRNSVGQARTYTVGLNLGF